MKSSKPIGAVFLAAGIGWLGFSIAESVYAKLPVGAPGAGEVAVVAVASAAEAHDALAASRPAPSLTAAPEIAKGEPLPDPVAVGPAEEEALPVPSVAAAEPAPVEFEDADLLAAVQQGTIQATLRGNGRERMTAQLRNNSPTPMRVSVAAGQVLEGGRNRVIVTRTVAAELMPAHTADVNLVTAALHSSNTIGDAPYKFSYQNAERVEGFLQWAKEHGGLSAPAMQTAVLALTENLPLQALAKFAAGTPDGHGTDAFRAETGELIESLTALRDFGAKLETFAIAADPQLRIEAMIEPLSRESAKRYYGISEAGEWEFWKHELLEGNPSTRHYALFGIARFYPDVALEMLPKWAREPQTHPVFRLSAVQALADTQRPEALPILRSLAGELGATTELGKAATQAANYLDKRLNELANRPQIVAFRDKARMIGL
ncbi:MAG: HEAT repeat domain-containing protein [Chthoniobacteraceae bacterium]